MKIKECIRGECVFQFYRDSILYYRTENGLLFPIPTADTDGATFNRIDKGIFFMRWIRKFLESVEK